jgi:hypothetical protein
VDIEDKKRKFCVVLIVAALCPAPFGVAAQDTARAATPPSHDAPRSIAQKSRVTGVPNFGTVTPALYRGGQPTPKGFESLSKMGVGIVADLREGKRRQSRGRGSYRPGDEIRWNSVALHGPER